MPNYKLPPSANNKPDNISNKAISIWEYIIRRYADDIYTDARLLDKQWANAIEIFERVCKARDIKPYCKLCSIAKKLQKMSEE